MNILVTGGSGFIGKNLVSELLKDGHRVVIYDKRKCDVYPEFCTVGDIRDQKKLTEALVGIDAVYHLAAEHHDNVQPASLYYDVNVGGAENLVFAAKQNKVKKLIFTSSVAVYGFNAGESDENSSIKPFNDYGKSKYEAEVVFNNWAKGENTACLVIVRPTVIFGEGNRGNVYNLVKQIASKRFIMVGDGKNKKSMGYVLNLVRLLIKLLHTSSGRYVYNFADKPDLNMNEFVRITLRVLGNEQRKKIHIPYSIGLFGGITFDLLSKVTKRKYSISAIRIKKFCANTVVNSERLNETGFIAPYQLIEGINRMVSKEFL
ncbi:MAG: NAD(P)-dependent oxidoreductase [Deltaproteobacteria bacterium]|jgi:nucleoside-diphosphate-sugar epimerase|nr:NAD(P)-dependent oxidoreductase [Deltaproteobacteria bacterium]